jgi:hypothetical protein
LRNASLLEEPLAGATFMVTDIPFKGTPFYTFQTRSK